MEDISGKNITDIPGLATLKTLEKRQAYLLTKLQDKIEESSYFTYIAKEMRALEKTKNFVRWMLTNSSDSAVKTVLEKYKAENTSAAEEEAPKENGGEEKTEAEIYGVFHEKRDKQHKIEIVLSRAKGIEYVTFVSKHREDNGLIWISADKIAMTLHKLEKIIERARNLSGLGTGPD